MAHSILTFSWTVTTIAQMTAEMEKTFQRASNTGVNFFLALVKCVPNLAIDQ